MALPATSNLTYDDYVLIPEDGLRHEIIEGEHFASGAPDVRHQRVLGRLLVGFASFIEEHGGGEVLPGRLDLVLSQSNVVQPDIVYLRTIAGDGDYLDHADLVIAILTIENRFHDEVRKLKVYGRFGVPEYWVVDPEANVVNVYRRENGVLTLVEQIDKNGTITTPLLPGFSLQAQTVFA